MTMSAVVVLEFAIVVAIGESLFCFFESVPGTAPPNFAVFI